ncbi:MAG: hypothetical protein QE271_01000 [Bacteriovoracaceae bacterium]|nr:hypothetical protein [Bacteriovoracaceae bacterium]
MNKFLIIFFFELLFINYAFSKNEQNEEDIISPIATVSGGEICSLYKGKNSTSEYFFCSAGLAKNNKEDISLVTARHCLERYPKNTPITIKCGNNNPITLDETILNLDNKNFYQNTSDSTIKINLTSPRNRNITHLDKNFWLEQSKEIPELFNFETLSIKNGLLDSFSNCYVNGCSFYSDSPGSFDTRNRAELITGYHSVRIQNNNQLISHLTINKSNHLLLEQKNLNVDLQEEENLNTVKLIDRTDFNWAAFQDGDSGGPLICSKNGKKFLLGSNLRVEGLGTNNHQLFVGGFKSCNSLSTSFPLQNAEFDKHQVRYYSNIRSPFIFPHATCSSHAFVCDFFNGAISYKSFLLEIKKIAKKLVSEATARFKSKSKENSDEIENLNTEINAAIFNFRSDLNSIFYAFSEFDTLEKNDRKRIESIQEDISTFLNLTNFPTLIHDDNVYLATFQNLLKEREILGFFNIQKTEKKILASIPIYDCKNVVKLYDELRASQPVKKQNENKKKSQDKKIFLDGMDENIVVSERLGFIDLKDHVREFKKAIQDCSTFHYAEGHSPDEGCSCSYKTTYADYIFYTCKENGAETESSGNQSLRIFEKLKNAKSK